MEIDSVIESLVSSERTISVPEILSRTGEDARLCIARLNTLEKFTLAKIEEPGVWRLPSDWQRSLQELSDYRDVMDRLRPVVSVSRGEGKVA